MFSETELYDAVYGSFKDYESEAAAIAERIRAELADASSVLDVACGTGSHAMHLHTEHGFRVTGIDIEAGFVQLASGKVPEASFHVHDMADFDLGQTFDVVLCLFSSIGYLLETDRVVSALESFRRHLRPGGIAMVEPWFGPGDWYPGRRFVHDGEDDGVRVVRMSLSGVDGRISTLEFHYLIGTEDSIEHRTEHHQLLLLSREELTECFERAGFPDVAYDAEGLTGRGLYVARAT